MPATINTNLLHIREPVDGQPVIGDVECQVVSAETGQAGPWIMVPVRFGSAQDASRRKTIEWAFARAREKLARRMAGRADGTNLKPIDQPADGETE